MNFWKETIKNGHLYLTCDLEITSWFSESVYAAMLFVAYLLRACVRFSLRALKKCSEVIHHSASQI